MPTKRTFYVNCKSTRDGDGSREMPFKHINDAAIIAGAGDEIIVAPGVYREYVCPVNSGTKENPVIYRSEKPLAAVITGAEELKDWTHYEGNVWRAEVDNNVFGSYNPYTTLVGGAWYFAPMIRHTGSVFINDLMMYETKDLEECLKGEPDPAAYSQIDSKYKWFTQQSEGKTIIYANFHGMDPNKENVEISVRRNCFMPDKNYVNYITVQGFTIKDAATTWAPPAAYQDGMIGPHWSKGWVIEDCEIYNSRCCGISLGKYLDPENEMYYFHKLVKSPTQMERDAICRGQYHGWLKERIGHHTIRRCNIHHCEQTGIVGRMGGVFSTIEDCHIHHICTSSQLGGAETAGIKLHAGIDVTIRRNHIHDNIMGIWLDWEAQGARITQNFLHDNNRPEGVTQGEGSMFSADVFIEVGHGPTLIDNNVMLSPVSLSMPSEGIACVHNLMLGGFSLINSGVDSIVNGQREPRYTPYHIRHRTEVAGFMTILHGDDRIYNNIFIQKYPINENEKTAESPHYNVVGTAPFDTFPSYEEWFVPFDRSNDLDMGKIGDAHFGHLPVWIDGNAYFNGSTVSKHEKNGFISDKEAFIELLSSEAGKYTIKTNVFELLRDFKRSVITTDTLGKAFEPEQRFENPDGTDIIFDKDYFGNHRGLTSIPGPFAEGSGEVEIPV
ncbi:Right handed beta helix region [Eubacterium ruminantium]|nr:Right handed beta helix region [Eubacterium ruminantium]